jgi:hypothetical protein
MRENADISPNDGIVHHERREGSAFLPSEANSRSLASLVMTIF